MSLYCLYIQSRGNQGGAGDPQQLQLMIILLSQPRTLVQEQYPQLILIEPSNHLQRSWVTTTQTAAKHHQTTTTAPLGAPGNGQTTTTPSSLCAVSPMKTYHPCCSHSWDSRPLLHLLQQNNGVSSQTNTTTIISARDNPGIPVPIQEKRLRTMRTAITEMPLVTLRLRGDPISTTFPRLLPALCSLSSFPSMAEWEIANIGRFRSLCLALIRL